MCSSGIRNFILYVPFAHSAESSFFSQYEYPATGAHSHTIVYTHCAVSHAAPDIIIERYLRSFFCIMVRAYADHTSTCKHAYTTYTFTCVHP